MNKLRGLAALMCITILVITGFQIYWLKYNYEREKRSLEIKTNMAFRRTIRELQASKLRLDPRYDSIRGKVVLVQEFPEKRTVRVKLSPKEDVLEMANMLRQKIADSTITDSGFRPTFIPIDKNTIYYENEIGDSSRKQIFLNRRTEKIFQFLYGVDSLQDSIRIKEIVPAFSRALKKENAEVPFSIIRIENATLRDEPAFNETTIGFAHPVMYKLNLGNTLPYLLKRISIPILVSIFLVGVTIFSFLLLYRNLLRQRRLALMKNEFISNITHELKTPIATVSVAIEALRNFNAMLNPEKAKEYLDISANELQRLSLLVDKVLKLSMFENKKIELKYESITLADLVHEVVSSMRLQFEKNKAVVTIDKEGDLNLNGDRLHLLSVVYNLLDNALKYSNHRPEIHIKLQGESDHVVMTVSDNGIGVAPEYKDKIFDKFFRVPMGNTHNFKGYGLGLSYASQVIDQHGGKITVESKPGSGSTFTVILPKKLS
jgi:two-component system, OmpR family, phosphate regulon sensor histidine kinase PhoR